MELKHALLGLLSIQPMSGYDMSRAITNSLAHFWYVDRSQVYRTLARLEEEGALSTETRAQSGKPDRHVHSLTERGHELLREWLASPLPEERTKNPFLARLFFAGDMSIADVERLLEERESHTLAFRQELTEMAGAANDLASFLRDATLRNGITHAEAELDWLRDTRNQLASFKDAQ